MAEVREGSGAVDARVVYWGIQGAGKSLNLRAVHGKLRPDHRGEIREVPTRFDPTVCYEVLPIELGEIAGVRTRIQIVAAPGAPEQAPTRKQLLDRVDGIVLVLDAAPEREEENLGSFEELREGLAAYGRSLDEVPLVIQYNKRDQADPFSIESLHRKLDVGPAPVFEAVATEGTGVLQTLSTISKRVIRSLRDPARLDGVEPAPEPEPPPAPPSAQVMEEAILEEDQHPEAAVAALDVETALETPAWEQVAGEIERPTGVRIGRDLSIVSVGEAQRTGDRRLRVPLVLGDASGQTTSVALHIELEALVDEDC